MSKLTVSRYDFNIFKNDVTNTYATKSEIKAANYSKIGDLADYALKSDLSGYQVKGDYALKSELSEFQPKGDYALNSALTGLKSDLSGYQVKGDYALNSALTGLVASGNTGLTKEEIVSLVKSTMASQGDDLVVKGNIRMIHPNGDEWVIGMRDQNHFAINKLDKTGKNPGGGSGILVRHDGHMWAVAGGFHAGSTGGWHTDWQHNINKGRR
jgi:hypothetical protein